LPLGMRLADSRDARIVSVPPSVRDDHGIQLRKTAVQLGMIGLGRMGANMARRVMRQGHQCVVQDANYKYVHFAALPPLFFDLNTDPHQFRNLAADPAVAALVLEYAQRALSWRLRHADRTLTHYRASPDGLQTRISGEKS